MEPDKRRFVRKRTDQLLYAEFGPDNGSILLNLSEDGCSFQSMAPVRDEQLRFSVSIGDGRKLEGDGHMVWSDTAKKTGGLRFLNPSAQLREQVREWLAETLVTADGKLDLNALDSKTKRRRKKLREEARTEAELAWNEGALKAGEEKPDAETGIETAKAARVESLLNLTSKLGAAENVTLRPPGTERPTGNWRGVGAIALAAVLLVVLIAYRRELGHMVMSFGSSIAGDERKAGGGSAAEPRAVPENVTSTGASNGTPNKGSDATSSEKPAAMSVGDTTNENGAESKQASNEQSRRPADASSGTAKRSVAHIVGAGEDVPALWTSVENGDTHAEVALAGRYVRGDGVPQSCAQARVLLEAAAKRGSSEAKQKLDDLGQAGCP